MTNILIINERTYLRDFISKELAHERYRVATVGDAERIWENIKVSKPDLVLLDLYLDKNDSCEVLRNIKKKDPNLPVLVYTIKSFDAVERLKKTISEVMTKQKFLQSSKNLSPSNIYYSY